MIFRILSCLTLKCRDVKGNIGRHRRPLWVMMNGVIGQLCQIRQDETDHKRDTRTQRGLGRTNNGADGSRNIVPMHKWGWIRLPFDNRKSHWYGRKSQNRRGRATAPKYKWWNGSGHCGYNGTTTSGK